MNNSLYHAVRPTFHFERIPTIFSKKDVLLDRLCSVSAPSRIFLVFATVAVLPAPVSHTAARMYTILLLDLRLLRSRMFHFYQDLILGFLSVGFSVATHYRTGRGMTNRCQRLLIEQLVQKIIVVYCMTAFSQFLLPSYLAAI